MSGRIDSLAVGRARSVDALRGLTFVLMIFVNSLAGVDGISPWWKHMPADADAMSIPDIVFPAFLFIVGMALPFSLVAHLRKGVRGWALQRHILARAGGLIVLGLFMVNAEDGYDARRMAIGIAPWSLLVYAAALLVWGVWPRQRWRTACRAAGVTLLVVLALLYRGADGGSMTVQWWGILGLIGWAYLIASLLYQLARGKVVPLLLALCACVAYYAVAHVGTVVGDSVWHRVFSQEGHAAHTSIVLAGVVCSVIFFDTARAVSVGGRLGQALAFGLALAATADWLRPAYKISKIHATPSWCLYASALCVLVFAVLYWLIEVKQRVRWTRWVEPVAANPLLAYLIPFIVEAVMVCLGVAPPDALNHGLPGVLWSAAYVAIVVACVGQINRSKFRMQL